MRWLLKEIQEYLKQDPGVRLLIVEGQFDVELWGRVVPARDRVNVNVFPISSIEVPEVVAGGEKGRILAMAQTTVGWIESDRVLYFVDADFDRITGVIHPACVVISDGRDAESYVLIDETFACFCETGVGKPPSQTTATRGVARSLLRPMGLLRLADHVLGWRLPFQDTFADRGVHRFFRERRGLYSLQLDNLIDALTARVEPPPATPTRGQVATEMQARSTALAAVDDWQIIHGKDLLGFLSWYFKIPERATLGMVMLSIAACKAAVVALPNIGLVERWVRGT